MRYFEFKTNGKTLTFYCEFVRTRSGFKHICRVVNDSTFENLLQCKICYLNRTWEYFEFQSVLLKAVEKLLKNKDITKEEAQQLKEQIQNMRG